MSKYPVFLQDDESSCGVYCMKMIFKYYGINEDILTLKQKLRLDRSGATIRGMLEVFNSYHVEAHAYHASLDDIQKNIECPCILHLIQGDMGHFVVLYEMKDHIYIIGDPARGMVEYEKSELEDIYSESVISVVHIGRYFDYNEKTYRDFLKDTYKIYKKEFRSFIFMTLGISVVSFFISFLYSFLIDSIQPKSEMTLLAFVAIGYLLLNLIKIFIERVKERKWIIVNRELDKDYVYYSMSHIYDLKESYFMQDSGIIQSKILDLYELSTFSLEYFKCIYIDVFTVILLVVMMMWLNILMSMIVVMTYSLVFIYTRKKNKQITHVYKEYLKSHNNHDATLLNHIKQHNLYKWYLGKRQALKSLNRQYEQTASLKQEKEEQVCALSIGIEVLVQMGIGLILIIGLYFFHQKQLTMGQLFMFYMLQTNLLSPVMNCCIVQVTYAQNSQLYERYKELNHIEVDQGIQLEDKITSISLNNVSYAYGYKEEILKHIDMFIDHSFILTGKNGCGKSTLLKLLMGFDDNYSGEILINQHNLRDISKESLSKHITYLNETSGFIIGTVYENFMCNDEKKIKQLLKDLGLEEFISLLMVTLDGEGNPLSLGQKQIVCLIRALLRNYDVYLCDECFSHIDQRQMTKINKYLKKCESEHLFIHVSHQTKLVNRHLDYVIIEAGKIVNRG